MFITLLQILFCLAYNLLPCWKETSGKKVRSIISFKTGPYKFTRVTAGSRFELRGNSEALIFDSGLVTDLEVKCLPTSQPPHGPLHRGHSESLRDHRQCGVFSDFWAKERTQGNGESHQTTEPGAKLKNKSTCSSCSWPEKNNTVETGSWLGSPLELWERKKVKMSLPVLWENAPFKELCPPDDLDKSPGSPPV